VEESAFVQEMAGNDKAIATIVPFPAEDKNVFSRQRPEMPRGELGNSTPRLFHQKETRDAKSADGDLIAPPHFLCRDNGLHWRTVRS
jgi:hypothetical protein